MAESNAGFEPKPDYDYNTEDKIRRSHDVRVWDDGEIWLISQDGLTSIEPPHPGYGNLKKAYALIERHRRLGKLVLAGL